MIEKPVFLVGSERSGTTLLRLMLDHHPQIGFHFEFQYAVLWVGDDGTFPPIEEYWKRLGLYRGFVDSGTTIDRSLDYAELVDDFLVQKRNREGKSIVGATVHKGFHRLLFIWPDARFIHLVRDGRDVARSCIGQGWYGNMWAAGERWIEAERNWDVLVERIPPSRYVEITYEDLVRDPKETLDTLCRFIGVPFDEAMLSYDEGSTYDSPDVKLIAQWKRKLSERDIRLVEARLGGMLTARGYEPSGLPPLHVGRTRAFWLAVTNRIAVWRIKIKRYGFLLLALARITRSSPFTGIHARLESRKHRIDRQFIR